MAGWSASRNLMRPVLLLALLLASPVSAGPLVIAGGALDRASLAIHRSFLELALPQGSVVVIPSASATPAQSARAAVEALVRAGAQPDRIRVVQVASADDPATPDIDERAWSGGATAPVEAAKLADAAAIWFTGGDQLRTHRLLLTEGRDTPLLAAIRARAAAGAVIGGSSAGAAIMGRTMIARGDSLGALTKPLAVDAPSEQASEGERLAVIAGLGFLQAGLTDQHFDTRARLGRLVRALATLPPAERVGWGVDEDSALVIDASGSARVLGRGVTLVDARNARFSTAGRFGATGVSLTLLGNGDRIELGSLQVAPAAGRTPLPLPDAQSFTPVNAGGPALPAIRLEQLLATDLIGNPGAQSVERLNFLGGTGVIYRFSKLPGTRGWRSADGVTLQGIGFAVRPVRVATEPVGP